MGGSQSRKAGQGLSDPASRPADGRGADGSTSGVRRGKLDHRPGDQHQRRFQHGLSGTGGERQMLHAELIAPIPELLERHRKTRPDKVAYWDAQRSVTYSQLADRTAAIAGGLAARGVREGDRIAI